MPHFTLIPLKKYSNRKLRLGNAQAEFSVLLLNFFLSPVNLSGSLLSLFFYILVLQIRLQFVQVEQYL